MKSIFISYRRDDSAGHVGRIYDKLMLELNNHHIFRDIESIPPGVDFASYIDHEISKADVVLVVIGKLWATITDDSGALRINNANDLVRLEVASALKQNIVTIPVLVGGANLPTRDQLPPDLQDLLHKNALSLDDRNFHSNIETLIRAIRRVPMSLQRLMDDIGFSREDLAHNTRRGLSKRQRIRLHRFFWAKMVPLACIAIMTGLLFHSRVAFTHGNILRDFGTSIVSIIIIIILILPSIWSLFFVTSLFSILRLQPVVTETQPAELLLNNLENGTFKILSDETFPSVVPLHLEFLQNDNAYYKVNYCRLKIGFIDLNNGWWFRLTDLNLIFSIEGTQIGK